MKKGRKLSKVVIKGFKSIKELELDLGNLNILIGANGVGKSNFLQAFRFLKDISEGRMQISVARAGKADRLLHYGSRSTKAMAFNCEFGPGLSYSIVLLPAKGDTLITGEELVSLSSSGFLLSGGAKESGLKANRRLDESISFVYETLGRWDVYHFQDTSASAAVKKASEVKDADYLKGDAANLAAFLYRMEEKHPKHFERITRTVQMAMPFFHDFYLRPENDNPKIILLKWREKKSDTIFDADDLSDGSLRFICLTVLLLQPELPGLTLIDEPELGLHPHALSILAGMLRSASTRTQLIVSTQSPGLVDEFEPKDIVVVDRKDDASVFRRLQGKELTEWMKDYTLSELWEKNVIGGTP